MQTASPVCGTKNFSSVRLYSAPQLHCTIVAIQANMRFGSSIFQPGSYALFHEPPARPPPAPVIPFGLPADGVDAMLCPQFARHFCKLLRISSTLLLPENKKPGGAGWHRRTIVRSVLSITLQLFARAAALEPTSACESSIAHSHEYQRTSK